MRILARSRVILGIAAAALVAGCTLEDLTAPGRQLGDPLLDITLGPATEGALPNGSIAINSRRDTLTAVINNLTPLPTGYRWQFFLVDSATVDSLNTFNVLPVSGRVTTLSRFSRPVSRDSTYFYTTTATANGVSSIASADSNQTYTVVIQAPLASYSHFVVMPVATEQTTPSRLSRGERFGSLWARFRDARGTPSKTDDTFSTSATLVLGTFSPDAPLRVPFNASVSELNGAFRGTQVRINVRGLVRPPLGFHYAGWLLDTRTNDVFRLGGLQAPVPDNRPLDDAAVGVGPWYTEQGIIEAQLRGDLAGSGYKPEDFTRVIIVLEPNGQMLARPTGAIVLSGDVPVSVTSRGAAPGKVSGTVTSGSGASVASATVYLTGLLSPSSVAATASDATGKFLFRSVAPGKYKAYVIPRNGSTPTDSQTVTVGTRTVNGALVGDSVAVALHIP